MTEPDSLHLAMRVAALGLMFCILTDPVVKKWMLPRFYLFGVVCFAVTALIVLFAVVDMP